jgi:hypothetical protein
MVSISVPQTLIDQALGLVKTPFVCAEPLSESWLLCFVKNGEFHGSGDPTKFEEIMQLFLTWSKRPV